uniref:Uncharacterized protein n=1 Tax=Romanomermis culicivorax TaxID=13658 RepID=A0A915IB01_ROMCU
MERGDRANVVLVGAPSIPHFLLCHTRGVHLICARHKGVSDILLYTFVAFLFRTEYCFRWKRTFALRTETKRIQSVFPTSGPVIEVHYGDKKLNFNSHESCGLTGHKLEIPCFSNIAGSLCDQLHSL